MMLMLRWVYDMEIKFYEDKYLDSLNILLEEAFQVSKSGVLASEDIELIAVCQEEVVGHLLLHSCIDSIRNQKFYFVEYVCVKSIYRNQGIASKLFEYVFQLCKKNNVAYLELTSNPSRVAAHHLYHKLGFQIRETTVFRKEIL